MASTWRAFPFCISSIYLALSYALRSSFDPIIICAWLLLGVFGWQSKWRPVDRMETAALFAYVVILFRLLAVSHTESYMLPIFSMIASLYIAIFTPWSHQCFPTCLSSLLILVAVPWKFFNDSVIAPVIGPFLSNLTASSVAATYRYFAFSVYSDNEWVRLPFGSLLIYYGCTFAPLFIEFLKVALLLRGAAWISGAQQRWVHTLLTAGLLSIFLSTLRILILARLVPFPGTYELVHGPVGSSAFSALAALVYASFILRIRWTG